MRIAIIGFVLGVALLQQQAQLWSVWWYGWVLCLCLFLCLFLFRLRRSPFFSKLRSQRRLADLHFISPYFLFVLWAMAGFCWAGVFAQCYSRDELAHQWENQDIQVIGVVDSLPARSAQGSRFNFVIEEFTAPTELITASTGKVPRKIALAWYSHPNNASEAALIKPGERWRLNIRLKRPHGNANPYGFDYEAWLFEQGLRATGTVRVDTTKDITKGATSNAKDGNKRLDPFVGRIGNAIERTRYLLREKIQNALVDAPYAGVIVALVVGDQREISQSDWKVLNRTGIGHLISISGLHITMIAGLFSGLMHFLWRHSFFTNRQLPLLIPAPKIAVLAGAFAALVYVALAGFGVPAQRTLVMLIVVALALWTGRMTGASHILCAALGTVILFDPWAVMWPGFWLSFAAVGVLLYAGTGRSQRQVGVRALEVVENNTVKRRFISRLIGRLIGSSKRTQFWQHLVIAARVQYAVTVGLVPLSLLMFGQISLISPIANAVAIPLISFVVTPLALLGSIMPAPISTGLFSLAHACVSLLAQFLSSLSAPSSAVWSTPIPSPWMFVLATLGMVWMLAPKGWPMRYLGIFCWMPILLNQASTPAPGEMQVTAFDVGQGAAVLLETAHHRLLYDTGPGFSVESNSGTRLLLPYLRARGISTLDVMMISHSDNDHSGGALSLLSEMPVTHTVSSLKLDHPIVLASRAHQRCEAGQEWDWDGVHFEILHPVPVIYTSDKWKTNALSCTLKVSTRNHSLLLAGDIEAIQEDELVNRNASQLKADVLLAPHHGSGTSSTAAFLQAVAPQLALFQVGYLNRYHHPKPEVMQRYLDFGIKPLRTDTSGAITLQFGQALGIEEYRSVHARYWYAN